MCLVFKILLVLFVLWIIVRLYNFRTKFSKNKYLSDGSIVYKVKYVGSTPLFLSDDGGSEYVLLTGKVYQVDFTSNSQVYVDWQFITQPKVGNKYLSCGKDFTWNLSTHYSWTGHENDKLAKISSALADDIMSPEDKLFTTMPKMDWV